jgi:hypothetical protein
VLFLGDSFTFGQGLAEADTLPSVVGQALEQATPGFYEVVNGGVYGYSTGDALNLLEKFGVPIEPDLVVTLMILDDMVENLADYRLTDEGALEKVGGVSQYNRSRQVTRFIPVASWLREHSHLFKFVGVRALPILASGVMPVANAGSDQRGAHDVQPVPHESYLSPAFYADERGAFAVTSALLTRLAGTAMEHGARSLLLTLGGDNEIDNGRLAAGAMIPHAHLARTAIGGGFSDAMALPPLLAECQSNQPLFFADDGHWTAAGTRCVAPAVAAAIAALTASQN